MIHYSCESVRSVLFKVEIEEARGSSAMRSPCLSSPQAVRRTAGGLGKSRVRLPHTSKIGNIDDPMHPGHQILGAAIRALARLRL